MEKFVLDSFALIAYFNGEPAGIEVKELLRAAKQGEIELILHSINFCEVLYSMERKGEHAASIYQHVNSLPITIVDHVLDYVLRVAKLKATYPISLPDCYAAVTAQDLHASVVTGDPDFKKLKKLVKIRWLK